MTEDFANKVYDILINMGGASEDMRDSFVYHHVKSKDGCDEWRFGGKLGFGGKYRSRTNSVDCYAEDETSQRKNIISQINNELSNL